MPYYGGCHGKFLIKLSLVVFHDYVGTPEGETAWVSAQIWLMTISLSVGEVHRHIAILERMHDDALNRASALYFIHEAILVAVCLCVRVCVYKYGRSAPAHAIKQHHGWWCTMKSNLPISASCWLRSLRSSSDVHRARHYTGAGEKETARARALK